MMTKKNITSANDARMLQIMQLRLLVVLVSLSVLTLVFLCPHVAYSAQATLSWNPPTKDTSGAPLTNLAGFKIYYGTQSHNYSQTINVGNVTSSTVSNLTAGTTYYFAVTAYNTSGLESDYSNEVSKIMSGGQQYSLSVSKSGAGSGTVTSPAGGIDCGTSCAATYTSGSVVTLSAAPSAGSNFAGWSGGSCTGTGSCSLAINSNMTVTAIFDSLNSNCTATLSSDLSLFIPIINFNGEYLQGHATCYPDTLGGIMCLVTSYGGANPYQFSNCQASTLTPDLKLHVPVGIYDNIYYHADFEFMSSTGGQIWFKLITAVKN